MSLTLTSAETLQEMIITRITTTAHKALRLRELGFCEGRRVRVLQGRDPLLCELDRARVGLARGLADGIVVRPVRTNLTDAKSH